MASGRGSGRGRGRDFVGGRGSFGGGRGSYSGRQTVGDKGFRKCKHCGRNNISEKYWEKFDRPEWAQLVDTDTPPCDIAYIHAPSATHSGTSGSPTVIISQEEMIHCVSSSSLRTISQRLMHLLQV